MLNETENTLETTQTQSMPEATPVEQPTAQEQSVPKKETQKELNLRILRERAEAERQARLVAEQKLQELEKQLQYQQPKPSSHQDVPQESDNDDVDFSFEDDSYIEGKHLKKYVSSLKKEIKQTKKQLEEYNKQTALTLAEQRLKSQYNDFEVVVTQDNLKNLAALYPDDYASMMSNPDIVARGKTAYNMINRYGISDTQYDKEAKRLEENKLKPRSVATAAPQSGETPLSRVGDYDRRVLSEERKENLRRMVAELKKRG
jgi:hypothetical protein